MTTKNGYTLIEIMVALGVFAILSAITASAMHNAFNTRERVDAQANRLNAVQLALTLIARDTEQVIDRSITGNEMRTFPPFVGQSNYLEFTRGGSVNPNESELRSTLRRVAYACRGKKLIRRSWDSLDTPERDKYHDKVILDNLDSCAFAYITANQQTLQEWREYAVQQNQKKETLPSAIEFKLTIKDWGNMSLLFPLPGAIYAGTI